ncbi:MAG: PilZ domain-containing protein [Myxococcaceae bacterium]|nr:PilZ domain-containing protein [Myxococcaceae bacterium]MCA3011635.1 PilZ domain-containing protein [Myxococcaceae bacterium]
MSDFDRRRRVRVNVSVPIEVRDGRGFSFHSTRDLSSSGCFFDRAIPHAVGARVALSFALPGEGRTIRCEAEVVNVPDRKGFGMGLRFLNLAPADEQRIEAFAHSLFEGEGP